jgi:hypothetical protein
MNLVSAAANRQLSTVNSLSMPRFVILRHELPPEATRGSHWDLMFEAGATLRTWSLETAPDLADEQVATPLPDHRREYLTYEGPVSGNRGSVARWDEGTFEVLGDDDEAFVVEVAGRRLHGRIMLTKTTACRYRFEAD